MNEEMRIVKFDLKRKKQSQSTAIEDEIVKRKNPIPLSSEICKSPFRKSVKYFDNQNPGSSYFLSLIRTSQQEEHSSFVEYLRSLKPDVMDLKMQAVLKLVDYRTDDEPTLEQQLNNNSHVQGAWTAEESKLLVWIVSKLGMHHSKWKEVGLIINHRSTSDCKQRWSQLLQLSQKGQSWTEEVAREPFATDDDLELLKSVQKHGKRWHRIQKEWQNKRRTRTDIKKRFYELVKQSDSGYESDSSAVNRSKIRDLSESDQERIRELIGQLKQNREMQLELKSSNKTLKNKLMNITKSDLDQMMSHQRQVPIQKMSPLEQQKEDDVYKDIEEDPVIQNTPMNNLSRSLLKINLESGDDDAPLEKHHKNHTATYNVEPIEQLSHEDLFDIRFCLFNENTNTLYHANLEFMQQLINLITNQRKLMTLTSISPRNLSPQRQKNKKFTSQQLIQVFPAKNTNLSWAQVTDEQPE